MAAMLDLTRIRNAAVKSTPYPYFVVEGAIDAKQASKVAADFPEIERPGAINVDDTQYGPAFGALLDSLQSDAFRKVVSEKLDVDLEARDIVINVRGQVRLTDGNIHTDTPSKLVTVLLYFNEPGTLDETGLRILKNGKDLDDYVEEVSPDLGNMLVFKVTPNCWHGHGAIAGKRRSLQLNYLSGVKTIGKHQLAHRLVGRMKRKVAHLVERAG
jgi:SM-20-related protein